MWIASMIDVCYDLLSDRRYYTYTSSIKKQDRLKH